MTIMRAGTLSVAVALLLGAARAGAQAPAPPPAPTPATAPPLLHPSKAPPPPPPTASLRAASASTAVAPTATAVKAPKPAGTVPPDSVRPKAAPAVKAPPANATAQCGDGSFMVAPNGPSGCSAHGGMRVVMAHPAPAPATPPNRTAAVRAPAVPAASASAPAGATMRCKDGTYLTGAPAESRCTGHGGVGAMFETRGPAPGPKPRRP